MLIHGPRPGRFLPLVEGTTLYVEGRLPDKGGAARFSGFFLSREAGRVVVLARRASMTLAQNQAVVIHLRNGELQHRKARGLRRVHFNSLRFSLDLAPALRRHLGFLTRLAASQDRLITAPLSCLTLGMLLAGLCLGGRAPARTSGLRLAARGLLAVALYQAAFWGVSAAWPGPAGVVLVSALVLAGGALWLWR